MTVKLSSRSFLAAALSLTCFSAIAGGPEYYNYNDTRTADSGFYITAGVNGAGYQATQSSNTSFTLTPSAGNLGSFSGGFKTMATNSMNFSWGGGIGWQFNSMFRVDLSYLYMNIPLTGMGWNNTSVLAEDPTLNWFFRGTGTSNMGFADAYLDIAKTFGFNLHYFSPYVGVGAGFSRNRLFNVRMTPPLPVIIAVNNATHTDFAWRAIAGVNFALTRHLVAYTQYNYISAGNYISGSNLTSVNLTPTRTATLSSPLYFHIYSNVIGVGLTYLF